MPQVVLSIAGHDPSSGAGITADLQTFAAHHLFGVSAITALTVQSTLGVAAVSPVDPALLAAIQSGVLATKDIPAGLKGTGFSPSVSPTRYPGASAPEGATTHPSAGLSLQQVEVPHGEPLRLELENFLNAVRTRTAPRVTGDDGRAALALALEINDRIAAHAQRAGLA